MSPNVNVLFKTASKLLKNFSSSLLGTATVKESGETLTDADRLGSGDRFGSAVRMEELRNTRGAGSTEAAAGERGGA